MKGALIAAASGTRLDPHLSDRDDVVVSLLNPKRLRSKKVYARVCQIKAQSEAWLREDVPELRERMKATLESSTKANRAAIEANPLLLANSWDKMPGELEQLTRAALEKFGLALTEPIDEFMKRVPTWRCLVQAVGCFTFHRTVKRQSHSAKANPDGMDFAQFAYLPYVDVVVTNDVRFGEVCRELVEDTIAPSACGISPN